MAKRQMLLVRCAVWSRCGAGYPSHYVKLDSILPASPALARLVVENDQDLADEITARLRALRPSGPVSVDAGRARVRHVLQPYLDDLIWRKERGARRTAADIAIAVLLGLYECRDNTDEDMLLVRMGLPGVGRRPRTNGVQEGEVTALVVAVAGGRVPRVDVVRGELNPSAPPAAACSPGR
jgi:hypothetical protein